MLKICLGLLSVSSILFGADDNKLLLENMKKSIDTFSEAKINSLEKEANKEKECNKYLDKVDKLFTTLESFRGEAKIR